MFGIKTKRALENRVSVYSALNLELVERVEKVHASIIANQVTKEQVDKSLKDLETIMNICKEPFKIQTAIKAPAGLFYKEVEK